MKKLSLILILSIVTIISPIKPQSVIIDSVYISNGNSLSTSLNTKGYQLTSVKLPDGLSGTSITFQVNDGLNSVYSNLIKSDGTELEIKIPASAVLPNRRILIPPVDNLAFNYLVKLRTGTYAAPTVQSSSYWIIVELTKMISK